MAAAQRDSVTGRQSHIRYTSQEKRIIHSNYTNGYIDKDLKLEKEEEGKGRGEVSYIYTLRQSSDIAWVIYRLYRAYKVAIY